VRRKSPPKTGLFSDDWKGLPTTARVVEGGLSYAVLSPADPVLQRLEQITDHRDQVVGAHLALRDDPGCIAAHLFLGQSAVDAQVGHDHLARAVETGKALWEPVAAAEEDFCWWGYPATRPYMKAIAALGAWHAEFGKPEDARELYQSLLTMNPYDNQGIRHRMAELEPEVAGMGM